MNINKIIFSFYLITLGFIASCSNSKIESIVEAIKLENTSTIKGVLILDLGTPSETIDSLTPGSVTISYEAANNTSNLEAYKTFFDINSSDAAIKVVKYSITNDTDNFDNDTEDKKAWNIHP